MSKNYRIKHLKLSKVFMGCIAIGIVPACIQFEIELEEIE